MSLQEAGASVEKTDRLLYVPEYGAFCHLVVSSYVLCPIFDQEDIEFRAPEHGILTDHAIRKVNR